MVEIMKLGSLFSGAGLGDLGWMMAGFDIKWQVEIDKYCQKVLDLRFPETNKYYDIKTLKGKELEPVDIVAGGFPCQPFSVAGKQDGDKDNRNLWPEMFRIIKEVRPSYVVGENVPGIINIYLDNILSDLESEGYSTRTFVFPAHSLGANHRRERIWIVGYSGLFGQKEHEKQTTRTKQSSKAMSDTANSRIERMCEREKPTSENVADAGQQYGARNTEEMESSKTKWSDSKLSIKPSCERFNGRREAESRICRITNVSTKRVDRLKCLGNGQVVACTAFIGQQIMEFERKLTKRKEKQ